ncbi:MAG: hypothetical protein IJH14_10965 [Solobacterium sp.]|nr:hypothetical protein [Solobacterium sp.]
MSEFQTTVNNTTEEEIDLVEIFYLLWNNFLKILLCFVLGAVIAFGYSFFLITPMYKATAKMYINSSTKSVVDMADLQISSNLRSDYKELITSRELLETVIKSLRLEYEPSDLNKMIAVGNPTDTRIITVTVTSASPQEAADVANELVNKSKVYLPEIMKSEEPVVYESALVPVRKSSPSYSRNTLLGGLVGAFLFCAYLIVKHLMNDTIVTPDDAMKYLGVQPLAVIPEGDLGNFNKKRKNPANKKGK